MTCTICSSPDHSRSNCPMRRRCNEPIPGSLKRQAWHCTKCGRLLLREPVHIDGWPYGPTCEKNLFGATKATVRANGASSCPKISRTNVVRDGMTLELFA